MSDRIDPSEAVERMSRHLGKVDRQLVQWRRAFEKSKVTLEPKTDLEKEIKANNETICDALKNGNNIPLDNAVGLYLNIRDNRHDVWVDLINRTKAIPMNDIGDVNLTHFIRQLKAEHNITLPNPPNIRELQLTPDVLVYNRNAGFILLGDVAVTSSVEFRNNTKTLKYAPIKRWLEEQNMLVVQKNFIIHETLNNLESELAGYERIGIIQVTSEQKIRAASFHRTCHNDMNRIYQIVDDPSELRSAIDRRDKVMIGPETFETPQVDAKVETIQTEIEEGNIISWVKEITDQELDKGYYDTDITTSINKLDEMLKDKQEDRIKKPPKSTLMTVENCYEREPLSSHDLIESFVKDIASVTPNQETGYVLDLLPNNEQLGIMKESYNKTRKVKDVHKRVFGPFQYSRDFKGTNTHTINLNHKLELGKKKRNEKEEPTTIDQTEYNNCFDFIESSIEKFGSTSLKDPFLDDSWLAKNRLEKDQSMIMKDAYDYVKRTNGAQLAHTLSNFYQRITHLKTNEAMRDNIYVPPNGAFIAIIPKNHSPITSANCDLPCIFITRYTKGMEHNLASEYDVSFTTDDYVYYVSKLCRFNVDKISNWDQAGYKLTAVASYILAMSPKLFKCKERVVGILTYFALDIHQKTSEYLDLLKYISFMPFAQISRLSKLVEDKMNILKKTRLDVWLLITLRNFMNELSHIDKLDAKKPVVGLFNGMITRDSLGLSMKLPSFFDHSIRHDEIHQFIEEVNTLYIIRPKHLYGSQFMDKSIDLITQWNNEFIEEQERYGSWLTTGTQECGIPYPFNSKFAFCRDAILHAMNYFHKNVPIDKAKISREMSKEKYNTYMHYNCSLRGCTKNRADRKNKFDLHTTSLDEILKYYKKVNYDPEKCTVLYMGAKLCNSILASQYTMSEKDQRGAGRPIATPDLLTKALLMMIEKPEVAIGKAVGNNIIVSGKNKLQEQSEAYKKLVAEAAIRGFKKVFQITEDQTKFSENDNTRKYISYIQNNILLDPQIRKLQLAGLEKLIGREHLVKRLPKSVTEDPNKKKYVNEDGTGVKAIIGWPQGMLNFISTSIHSLADYWITYAFNKAYPANKVMTSGLVHSDDSWVAVACEDEESFVKYSVFRAFAKKLFCLKLNDKKVWGSKYLGELVSNYNLNGNVHLSVTKTLTNSFSSLMYQNWVIDVNSQVSCMQQAYRNGANLPVLILMFTIMKQQMLGSYQVKGLQRDILHCLPIELGGYPDESAYSLGVTGLSSHYNSLLEYYSTVTPEESPAAMIVAKAVTLSILANKGKRLDKNYRFFSDPKKQKKYCYEAESNKDEVIAMFEEEEPLPVLDQVDQALFADWFELDEAIVTAQEKFESQLEERRLRIIKKSEEYDSTKYRKIVMSDYDNVQVVGRGDTFTCVKHLMPKSNKITKTIEELKSLPFETNGIDMIVTRPLDLKESLGDLKARTSTILYQLASEHYTQSARRLAVSQAIQSSGKTVTIGDLKPMTINEMLRFLYMCEEIPMYIGHLRAAFYDDSGMAEMCWNIVDSSEYQEVEPDKRKVINRLPYVSDRFNTVCPLNEVLLKIIDDVDGTDFYVKYTKQESSLEALNEDIRMITTRFQSYFDSYQVRYACNLIMQQKIISKSSRLWMQPHLRSDSIENFLCDLYGKTVSSETNFKIKPVYSITMKNTVDTKIVNTIYTSMVLNKVYPGKFDLELIGDRSVIEAWREVDYINLTDQDYLKYAVIYKELTDDPCYIRKYETNREYSQHYTKSQKYVNGRYVGPFVCYVRCNKTVCKFYGEPSAMMIDASTYDTYDITKAMMEFVSRNFIMYKYEHPSQWSLCPIWTNTTIIPSGQYLNYFNSSITVISSKPNRVNLPIKVNQDIYYPVSEVVSIDYDYDVDETLRKVYKIIDNEKMPIGTISQSLETPLSDICTLKPAHLYGLDNDTLFKTRAIVSISTNKFYNTSIGVYRKILDERLSDISQTSVVDMFTQVINGLSKNKDIVLDIPHMDVEYETIEIHPMQPHEAVDKALTADVADIEAIECNFELDQVEKITPKLYHHTEIPRLICRILHGMKSIREREDFLYCLMNRREFREEMAESVPMSEEDFLDKAEEMRYVCERCPAVIPKHITEFIVGNNLDRNEGYLDLDLVRINRERNRVITRQEIDIYASQCCRIIIEELLGKDYYENWFIV